MPPPHYDFLIKVSLIVYSSWSVPGVGNGANRITILAIAHRRLWFVKLAFITPVAKLALVVLLYLNFPKVLASLVSYCVSVMMLGRHRSSPRLASTLRSGLLNSMESVLNYKLCACFLLFGSSLCNWLRHPLTLTATSGIQLVRSGLGQSQQRTTVEPWVFCWFMTLRTRSRSTVSIQYLSTYPTNFN